MSQDVFTSPTKLEYYKDIMSRSAIGLTRQTNDPELPELFTAGDCEIAADTMATLQERVHPMAYAIIKRALRLSMEQERQTVLGFCALKLIEEDNKDDVVAQVMKAWEVHEAVKFENLAELVPTLNPEDRPLDVVPPDVFTLLGQEAKHTVNGLARFALSRAYKCAPLNQKIMFAIRSHNLLGRPGALRQFLGAIQIWVQAWKARRKDRRRL